MRKLYLTLLFPLITNPVGALFASEGENENSTYETDPNPFTWSKLGYVSHKYDFDGDGVKDLFLQPTHRQSQFILVKGEYKSDTSEVSYKNANVITSTSWFEETEENPEKDWSTNTVSLVFGQFSGDASLDAIAFSHNSDSVFLVEGTSGELNFDSALALSEDIVAQVLPFSFFSEHYLIRSGDLDGDGASEIIAIASESRVNGNKLDHYIVNADPSSDGVFLSEVIETKNKGKLKSNEIGDVFVEDFNGNGAVEVFVQGVKENKHYYFASLSTDLTLEEPVEFKGGFFSKAWKKSDAKLIVDDVNDDGLLDIVRYSRDPSDTTSVFFTPADESLGVQAFSGNSGGPNGNPDTNALNLRESDPQGSVELLWDAQGHDVFEVEKWTAGEWLNVYVGFKPFYYDANAGEGLHEYRVSLCKLDTDTPTCTVSLQNSIEVVFPESENSESIDLLDSNEIKSASLESFYPAVPQMFPFAPANLVGNQSYTVGWYATSDADYYQLVGEQSGIIATVNAPTTSVSRSNLPGTYYYKVRACKRAFFSDPDGNNIDLCSNYSAVSPAFVVSGTPTRPKFTYAPTSATAGVNYTVSWDAGSGVIHRYQLVGELSGVLYSGLSRSTSRNKGAGTYYYKTRACNSYRCSGYTPITSGTVVAASNQPPRANDDSLSTSEDASKTVNVLANDSDPDGDGLIVIGHSQPTNGSVSHSSGVFTYTPNSNFCTPSGTYDTFNYTIKDTGSSMTSSAVVRASVTCVNDPPTVSPISNKTIDENSTTGNISFTVSDVETSAGSLTVGATSSNQTLLPDSSIVLGGSGANRTIKLTPRAYKFGQSTITVTVSDGNRSTSRTFLLIVREINYPPVANDGNWNLAEDGEITGGTNSFDHDGDAIVIHSFTQAGYGTVTQESDTTLKYKPNDDYCNTSSTRDSFNYTVKDNPFSGYATGTIFVRVTCVNDAPQISNISNKTIEENQNTGAISFTVTDVDDSPSTLTITGGSSNEVLVPIERISFGGSGTSRTVTVTPSTDSFGQSVISVTVTDPHNASDIDIFTLTVTDFKEPPVVVLPNTQHKLEQEFVTINSSVTAPDTAAGRLSYQWLQTSGPQVVGLSGVQTDSIEFTTPSISQDAQLQFQLTVTDIDTGKSDSDTIVITLNDRPELELIAPAANGIKHKSDDSLYVEVNNVRDSSDAIARVETYLAVEETGGAVTAIVNVPLIMGNTTGNYTYGSFDGLSLSPNTTYEVLVRPVDSDTQAPGMGHLKSRTFTVNDKPIITEQLSALTVIQGQTIDIFNSVLSIDDQDDAQHTLTIYEGASYVFNGTQITPSETFTGDISVPVSVNDGTEESELFTLLITVTDENGDVEEIGIPDLTIERTPNEQDSYMLNWTAVESVTRYELEEQTDDVTWNVVDTSLVETSYSFANQPSGTYNYRVRACVSETSCGGYSVEKSISITFNVGLCPVE